MIDHFMEELKELYIKEDKEEETYKNEESTLSLVLENLANELKEDYTLTPLLVQYIWSEQRGEHYTTACQVDLVVLLPS